MASKSELPTTPPLNPDSYTISQLLALLQLEEFSMHHSYIETYLHTPPAERLEEIRTKFPTMYEALRTREGLSESVFYQLHQRCGITWTVISVFNASFWEGEYTPSYQFSFNCPIHKVSSEEIGMLSYYPDPSKYPLTNPKDFEEMKLHSKKDI